MKDKRQIVKAWLGYFSAGEWCLWGVSVGVIVAAFCIWDRANYSALSASLIGVTFLIFDAKGHPVGQALTIVFCGLYGFLSYSFAYYGEMITYLGMTLPMAVIALISWLRHPYNGKRSQVKVNRLRGKEMALMAGLTAVVTTGFFFLLAALHTPNLAVSTLSVATSFSAVYLTFRRSAYYALAYAANDVVLIVLWALAAAQNTGYVSVVVCFCAFLVNDVYGFVSWQRMRKRQEFDAQAKEDGHEDREADGR